MQKEKVNKKMYLWDWLSGILNFFGLAKKRGKLVFIGLDNAGKTTLLYVLKTNKLVVHLPTPQPTSEELILDNITLTTYDLGGHKEVRRVWREYFLAIDAIVFLLDAHAKNRFDESKAELDSLLADELVANCPVLILGNKIDKFEAASEQEIMDYFGLNGKTTGKVSFDKER